MPVVIAYLTCALVWSTTWYAIRVCIAPGAYPTFLAAALRFTLASLGIGAVFLVGLARRQPRPRGELGWLVGAGLLNAVGYSLVYVAEERIPGGLAAVLYGTLPLATALLAAWTRTERLSAGTVAGSLLGLAGIAVIVWDRLEVSRGQAAGVFMVLGSVVTTAIYTVMLKSRVSPRSPLSTTAVFLPTTAAAFWLAVAVERQPVPWPLPGAATAALVYLAVAGSVITFASYFYLMHRVRLATLTTLVFVEPVLALGVDALWERDVRLAAHTYLGAAVTLGGVVVSLLVKPRRIPAAVPVPIPAAGVAEATHRDAD